MRIALIALIFGIVALATTTATDTPACLCTRILAPVCASNGITYANACEFKCFKGSLQGRAADDLKISRGGDCDGPEIPEFLQEL